MVATPKKVLNAVKRRLTRRPTLSSAHKTRTVSAGSRSRQTSRRLSDNLVHDMHLKMKAAAIFMDGKKDTEGNALSVTCTRITLTDISNSAVELALQVAGKVTKMPLGESVLVRPQLRSSPITIMVLQKDGEDATKKGSLRDNTANKATTPAKMLKKKFSSLRTSRLQSQESGLIGSAQVIADDLCRPATGEAAEITIMKDGRGKRSIVPLGCITIKATKDMDVGASEMASDSPMANCDIDSALSETNKENAGKENKGRAAGGAGALAIVHEGFLSVERDADRTGWKQYWARLLSSGELLCYEDQFINKDPGSEEMIFDLRGANNVSRPPMHEMPSRNGIKVSFKDGGDPFYLLAETMSECRAWISALETTTISSYAPAA